MKKILWLLLLTFVGCNPEFVVRPKKAFIVQTLTKQEFIVNANDYEVNNNGCVMFYIDRADSVAMKQVGPTICQVVIVQEK